ncbi:MAG: PEP/pyruvate-binding domain-containing protein, partial [Desulfobulbaceae bacterium]|nr:PEP/pyruvate-binding domain-containing protein [Desulfobulbaceae bacterium]
MFNRLRELFSLPRLRPAAGAASCSPAELVFEQFRRVLQINNRALTIIADLGEKLSGDYIFDQQYINRSVETLSATVGESIEALNILTHQQHQDLYPVYRELSERLQAIIARREDRQGPLLIALDKVTITDWAIVGGKNAHLAEMMQDPQLLVPDGFVITTCAYHELIDANNLREELDRFEKMMADPAIAEEALEPLRKRLEQGVLSAQPPSGLLAG